MRELNIDNLCIEITRRCNMACAHCLRGNAQMKDITHEVIDKALENVTSIGSLTFTGGEPSLNVPAMRYALEKCEEEGIFVSSFYVVTNGKLVTNEFLHVLMDWYVFCAENGGEAEYCGIALSKDRFHEPVPGRNELLLRSLSFFREDKFNRYDSDQWLLAEGRAAQIEGVTHKVCDYLPEISAYGNEVSIQDTLYVTDDGDVVAGCDWSYENQSKHQIGTVFDQSGWLEKLGLVTALSA